MMYKFIPDALSQAFLTIFLYLCNVQRPIVKSYFTDGRKTLQESSFQLR